MTLEVYLVRHGRTVFNTTGRLQGWSDSPLTEEGRTSAAALGRALAGAVEFDAAFSSPSPRAAETAKLILSAKNQNMPLTLMEEFREYSFGGLEGELASVLHQKIAEERGFPNVDEWLQAYRSGSRNLLIESVNRLDSLGLAESEEDFLARIRSGLQLLAGKAPECGKILLVSHGIAITAILKSIKNDAIQFKGVKNATVSKLEFDKNGWKIRSIGEELSR